MNPDHVPAWLVALLAFFGLTAAAAIILFQIGYARSAALAEERGRVVDQLEESRLARETLRERIQPLDDAIAARANKLQDLDRRDTEERKAVVGILTQGITEAKERVTASIQKIQEERKDLDGQADRAMGDLAQEERQATTRQQDNEAALRKYRRDIEEKSRMVEAQEKRYRSELLVLDEEIREREKRVNELLDRLDTEADKLRSDGIILQARVTDGFVIINRGLNHDLPKATRFVVYNRRAGRNYIKGEIEVVKIYPGMAECRVVEERDANDPLVPGDHIHHTVYNPEETKVFVVKGDFDLYTIPELKRFIKDAGGVVDKEIGSRTHYLVAGKNAEESLEEASLNGVTIMSERQLLEFVRRTERFKLTRGMVFAIAGDFPRVGRDVIEGFVERNGGVIEGGIDDNIDVLIAGDDAADEIAKARLSGAIIIDQDQLVHLMSGGGL